MSTVQHDVQNLIRRSKMFVPVNRERFIEKAWTRGADCIILDLEDAIAPADKDSARKMVKDVLPVVGKGGADIQVRINREFEEADLEAIILKGLSGVMIPKCESAAEIQRIDDIVSRLEKDRGLTEGSIQFDLIVETAKGVINAEEISLASPRIVQMNIGQVDLSVDLGFTRLIEMNFEQYVYAENKVRYAAVAGGRQPCGLGAQNNVDFTGVSMGPDAMFAACQHAFYMGYRGAIIIHPGWVKPVNEGFKPSNEEIELARKVKTALDEAYARGEGSVSVEGRMYDVANMKHVVRLLARADALAKKEAEKEAAVAKN
jgi:citrate lyase subunit beta / citryl-CoA lyase